MIKLRNVKQTFDFDCGPKALQTVMEYWGKMTLVDTKVEVKY